MDVTPVIELFENDGNINECNLSCQKVHEHTKNCSVCSQLYYSYINIYLKAIMVMLAIIILLFITKVAKL